MDVKLKLWMPFWWFDRETGGMSATKIDDNGVVGIYSTVIIELFRVLCRNTVT